MTSWREFSDAFALQSAINDLLFRKSVSLEAYSAISLRDIKVEVQRNGTDWLLDAVMLCETPDLNREHVGSWTVQLITAKGCVVKHVTADSSVVGDSNREAQVRFRMTLAADEVRDGAFTCVRLALDAHNNVYLRCRLILGCRAVTVIRRCTV